MQRRLILLAALLASASAASGGRSVEVVARVPADALAAAPWTAVQSALAAHAVSALYAPLPGRAFHAPLLHLLGERSARALWGAEWDAALWRVRKGLGALRTRLLREPLLVVPRVAGVDAGRNRLSLRLALGPADAARVAQLRAIARNLTGVVPVSSGDDAKTLQLVIAIATTASAAGNATFAAVEEALARALLPAFAENGPVPLLPAALCTFENASSFEELRKPIGLIGRPPPGDATEAFHRRVALIALVLPITIALGACFRVFRQTAFLPLIAIRKRM